MRRLPGEFACAVEEEDANVDGEAVLNILENASNFLNKFLNNLVLIQQQKHQKVLNLQSIFDYHLNADYLNYFPPTACARI